jgi:hypothetical protein
MNLLTPNAHCLAGQLVERRGAQVKVDVISELRIVRPSGSWG